MGLGNLATEHETDARPLRLGGEEWNEEILGIGNTRPFVIHPDFQMPSTFFYPPPHFYATSKFFRRLHGIANQIDQELIELIAIRFDGYLGPQGHFLFCARP